MKKFNKRRKSVLKKLSGKGVRKSGEKGKRVDHGGRGLAKERIDLSERSASAESGPGGSDLTDAELQDQIAEYQYLLFLQEQQRKYVAAAIAVVKAAKAKFTGLFNMERKKGKYGWRKAGYKKAINNADSALTDLSSKRRDLIGLTGKGGAIFDTKLRLADLGVATTVEGASKAARDSEISSLLREQLSQQQRNNAILSAQMPIFEQFMPKYHTGGVIRGRTEQPIMAMGGEGIFTPDQMAAMGGSGEMVVNVYVNGVKADPAQVRMEVARAGREPTSKGRRGNVGAPKYRTAGLR